MRITRASVAYDLAAKIDFNYQHPHPATSLGRSGYKCLVCGRFVQALTKGHAREHGYINKEDMLADGAAKRYLWGREVKTV